MLSTGRTCRVPTEACAYQVPRVPCLANTCVSLSVYSARCSSGTAQSSMNDTGLPSPFIDIMMLRPAFLTSHTSLCSACVGDLDHAAGEAELGHQLHQLPEFRELLAAIVAGEFDQQDRVRVALEKAVDDGLERGVAAREFDHRAVHQFHRRGRELDDMLRRLHRLMEASGSGIRPGSCAAAAARDRDGCAANRRACLPSRPAGARGCARAARLAHRAAPCRCCSPAPGAAPWASALLSPPPRAAPRHARARPAPDRPQARRRSIARAEVELGAVGEQRIDAAHVVHHVAVAYRARAAGVVSGHAAQRRLRAGGNIHRKPQAVRLEIARSAGRAPRPAGPRPCARPCRMRRSGSGISNCR